jgi:hypothetical protein
MAAAEKVVRETLKATAKRLNKPIGEAIKEMANPSRIDKLRVLKEAATQGTVKGQFARARMFLSSGKNRGAMLNYTAGYALGGAAIGGTVEKARGGSFFEGAARGAAMGAGVGTIVGGVKVSKQLKVLQQTRETARMARRATVQARNKAQASTDAFDAAFLKKTESYVGRGTYNKGPKKIYSSYEEGMQALDSGEQARRVFGPTFGD